MLSSINKNRENKETLIFFPFAGGAGEYYLPWFRHINKDIDCRFCQLPGRGSRFFDKPASDINSLIKDIFPDILKIAKTKVISFFGHSMGSIISFEIAKKLYYEYNIIVKWLFCSSFRAPSVPHLLPKINILNDQDLCTKIKDMGAVNSKNIELDDLKPFLSTLRSDFRICENYKYVKEKKLKSKIIILWGKGDNLIYKEKIKLWKAETENEFFFKEFEGNHFYLNGKAEEISTLINQTFKNKIYEYTE